MSRSIPNSGQTRTIEGFGVKELFNVPVIAIQLIESRRQCLLKRLSARALLIWPLPNVIRPRRVSILTTVV